MAVTVTELLTGNADRFSAALASGWETPNLLNWKRIAEIQRAAGLNSASRKLLSPPETQHKLGMGEVPSYGLTLHHHLMKSRVGNQPVINACPSAGACTRVCVIGNNFGSTTSVQLSWRWRTELLVHDPALFFCWLGSSLRKAADEHGYIWFRPNVNSDIEWAEIVPALVDGSIFGDRIKLYDYTKNLSVLDTDGWVTPHYRVAYSWNETSPPGPVAAFLAAGGAVAVVTDRTYNAQVREPIHDWHRGSISPLGELAEHVSVVDADTGDGWMFDSSVIGDLALKPRTRELALWGVESGFAVNVYHPMLWNPRRHTAN